MIVPVNQKNKPLTVVLQYVEKLKGEFTDARYLQIAYLSCFLCYGIYKLHWEVVAHNFLITLFVGLSTQMAGIALTKKPISSLKSALITILGITILLRAQEPYVYALAAVVAIASKFLVRFKGKHIINPANFGIVAAILLTGDAWISPGQWGNTAVLLFMIGAAGMMVLLKVGRLDLALPFLLVFGGLEFFRTIVFYGWPMDFFWHKMLNGSLMLFTFFMITDPKSTPNHQKGRVIFSVSVALLAFVLSNFQYVYVAPVWALFVLSPLTIFLDNKYKAKHFDWNTSIIKNNK
jgi:Na+-transporting NADH:ubiquinone oxidoreductase subunit NqrB